LSTLITPATLVVAPKAHIKLHDLNVNRPNIGDPDPWTTDAYFNDFNTSPQLTRFISTLASTGELPHFRPPGTLQSASCRLDYNAPIVHCQPSNETVRSLTAAVAFKVATEQSAAAIVTNTFTGQEDDLTWKAKVNNTDIFNASGYILYHGMIHYSYDRISPVDGEFWFAIANLLRDTIFTKSKASFDAVHTECPTLHVLC
jgi:hypothetical protein